MSNAPLNGFPTPKRERERERDRKTNEGRSWKCFLILQNFENGHRKWAQKNGHFQYMKVSLPACRKVFFGGFDVPAVPDQLYKVPTELRCRIFFTEHRLSIQIGAKRAIVCAICIHTIYSNGASILRTTVVGWVVSHCIKS